MRHSIQPSEDVASASSPHEAMLATPFLDALDARIDLESHGESALRRVFALPAHQGIGVLDPREDGRRVSVPIAAGRYDRAATPDLIAAALELDVKLSILYGEKTFATTGGGSGGNRIALRALLAGTERAKRSVAIAKGSHASVLGALTAIEGAMPRFSEFRSTTHGALLPPTPTDVRRDLEAYSDTAAVVITSPTMSGICADVESIACVVAEHNAAHGVDVRLHVDQAWAPHFAVSRHFPQTALAAGADSFSSSLHKQLAPALGQTAIFGVTERRPELVARARMIANHEGTTSPSSLLLVSIDVATAPAPSQLEALGDIVAAHVAELEKRMASVRGIAVLRDDLRREGIDVRLDPLKLVFRASGVDGALLGTLLALEGFRTLVFEGDYVAALFSAPIDAATADAILRATERAAACVEALIDMLPERPPAFNHAWLPNAEQALAPQAVVYRHALETVPITAALGRICAEAITPVPPGISIVTVGQRIGSDVLDACALWAKRGVALKGLTLDGRVTVAVT